MSAESLILGGQRQCFNKIPLDVLRRAALAQNSRLFGSLLALVYHCFDRIVILGHLPLLTRPENIVHFFRDVHGVGIITKDVLRQRTTEYHQ
jgi:hypothetical protein